MALVLRLAGGGAAESGWPARWPGLPRPTSHPLSMREMDREGRDTRAAAVHFTDGETEAGFAVRQPNPLFIAKPVVTFVPPSERRSGTRLHGSAHSWEQSTTFPGTSRRSRGSLFLSSVCLCASLCLNGGVTWRCWKEAEGKGGFIHHLP